MIRVTVSYPAAPGKRFDHAYYQNNHRALIVEKLTPHGLVRCEMDQCLADGAGKAPPIVASAHMLFNDLAGFQAGMGASGKALMGDVPNYTDIVPTIVVSEMK